MPIKTMQELFGTEILAVDDQDRGYSHELAGYALLYGSAPIDAILVQGSLHHVRSSRRIPHAWLELANRTIWEPVMGETWVPTVWQYVMRPVEDQRYTLGDVRDMLTTHRTWGPWPLVITLDRR